MRAVDTSLLAYAANRYAPEHPRASAVVEECANGGQLWALPWSVVHEFLALVTHSHAVARAMRPVDAWSFIEELAQSPTLRFLGPTAQHAAIVAEVLALTRGDSSSLPSGFDTAVLLREHGVRELLSSDRSMRLYRFLDVRDPVHGELWTPAEKPTRRYRTLTRRKGA